MESSIPAHLRCPRTQPRRVAESYTPSYPAWVARAPLQVNRVVMAYFGIQWRGPESAATAYREFARLLALLSNNDGPAQIDTVCEMDAAGFENRIAIAYWLDPERFDRWQTSPDWQAWWLSSAREDGRLGYFREVLSPRLERFETLLSNTTHFEGVAAALGQHSAEDISEHAYWGSMRERIPLSQISALQPSGSACAEPILPSSRRIRVVGHENVAIIRSGQEWTDTTGKERSLYLEEIEPTLRKGMEFLRDAGITVGCYSNRFVRHIDANGRLLDKTFGVSLWRSLAEMEQWAESHPTHIAIFGTFMRVVQALELNLKLRLYHEVAVVARDEQEYEYINCHPGTGMLRSLTP